MEENEKIIKLFAPGLLPDNLKDPLFLQQLTAHISHLINTDFSSLVHLLYRVDVHEKKLKDTLSKHKNEDAAKIIANMIVERQIEKIQSRKKNMQQPPLTDDASNERW